MASPTQWTGILANSRRSWRTGKPGMLQSTGSQGWTQCSNWIATDEDTSQTQSEPTLRTSLCLKHLSQGPVSEYSLILRPWGWRLQHKDFGGHKLTQFRELDGGHLSGHISSLMGPVKITDFQYVQLFLVVRTKVMMSVLLTCLNWVWKSFTFYFHCHLLEFIERRDCSYWIWGADWRESKMQK